MKTLRESLTQNGIFLRMFLITVVSVVAVSVLVTWTTIRMSERFYIETFGFTNAKVMDQVRDSFESFHYSVVLASNSLLQNSTVKRSLTESLTDAQLMSAYFLLSQQVKRAATSLGAYDVGIGVTGVNGVSYTSNRSYWPMTDEELARHPLLRRTLESPRSLLYGVDSFPSEDAASGTERVVIATKGLMDRLSGLVYGSMYFAVPERELRTFYADYTSPGNDVVILNAGGEIVSSNREEWIGRPSNELLAYATDLLERHAGAYMTAEFMGKEHVVVAEYLPVYDMYLINLIDRERAIGQFIDKRTIALISAGIALAALLIVFLSSRKITKALSRLVKQISSAPKFGFHQRVAVTGTYETQRIGIAFNSMLDELHEYVEQLMQSQKQQRQAELAALQQQINPHFLYNTLTSVKFMVQQGGKEEAADTIHALISLLQNTVGNANETISVREEIDNLKHYVLINNKRYGDRIAVNYYVMPDCLDCEVPKLVFQPFLENAFFHGFNRKTEGVINVFVWREGDELRGEVSDNGDGMELAVGGGLPAPQRKRQRFSGIGVRNVHDRIRLIYGEAYGVDITSEPGVGTTVHVRLPARKIEKSS